MLEHLVIVPQGGLCNRMRAIASARRIAARVGARCTIVWDWGDYSPLFAADTDWQPARSSAAEDLEEKFPGYYHIRHRLAREGGNRENRRVPVNTYPHLIVASQFVFGSNSEPLLSGGEAAVLEWFPTLHAAILAQAAAFKAAHFTAPTVGLHMRRTDHAEASRYSPDAAYCRRADRLAMQGYQLFLATDNPDTLQMMQARYGPRLIHFAKAAPAEVRWPKASPTAAAIVEDLIDLCLLPACDFVVGSARSSFSRVAILLNGSPRCVALDHPLQTWHARLKRWQARLRLSGGP